MAAVVINESKGTVKKVKNLGWLLRHRKDGIAEVNVVVFGRRGAGLEVTLENGLYFSCDFADLGICLEWVAKHLVKNGWVDKANIERGTWNLLRQAAGVDVAAEQAERSWGEQYVGRP